MRSAMTENPFHYSTFFLALGDAKNFLRNFINLLLCWRRLRWCLFWVSPGRGREVPLNEPIQSNEIVFWSLVGSALISEMMMARRKNMFKTDLECDLNSLCSCFVAIVLVLFGALRDCVPCFDCSLQRNRNLFCYCVKYYDFSHNSMKPRFLSQLFVHFLLPLSLIVLNFWYKSVLFIKSLQKSNVTQKCHFQAFSVFRIVQFCWEVRIFSIASPSCVFLVCQTSYLH